VNHFGRDGFARATKTEARAHAFCHFCSIVRRSSVLLLVRRTGAATFLRCLEPFRRRARDEGFPRERARFFIRRGVGAREMPFVRREAVLLLATGADTRVLV